MGTSSDNVGMGYVEVSDVGGNVDPTSAARIQIIVDYLRQDILNDDVLLDEASSEGVQ